ncbi:type IV secretory system conjugative DNA transfer family protein [Paraburkholderia hospita]|uniref:type IV secretory system conjugative DNA transfer family protein n=1 Tax=Paraburkholderia hospita TaxID=169430 RepID=UPI0008A73642|nr:type IV secretory system conjugative DNA transfer family protein [Paraburkholderia hospita]SEI14376.1 intracellular multiplication protein IcmO [Paraburkholderia hospita]
MAQQYGTSQSRELSQRRITLDPRTFLDRIGGSLTQPRTYARFQIGLAVLACVLAFVWLPITIVMVLFQLWFSWQRHEMPMRYPKDLGGIDPSLDVEKPHPKGKGEIVERNEADGILHIGNQRSIDRAEHLKELWVTNSDARTHMLLMGTTGSGKTVTLLSLCFNALAWGSGFFYSDGKADSSLHAAVWSLCRRVGREDDYLVLNFMTGGADPYKKKKSTEKSSNGTNPWFEGGPDFLSQLSSSLLPKASGDGAQWQQKAVNMMDALIRTLCYERAVGNITLSIGVIREYLALPNLVKLYLKGKKQEIPEFAFLPIKAYLETGLPGFKPDQADKPDKWDQTVWDQHGYLTGQYARTLSMLMDTYGYIFKDKYSEVDMMDVLLNRRILVVMIPTLEKSSQEAANLGKLVVSSIRLMMAMNLGHKLEGTYKDIIDTKATKSPAPYIITMDELGYYFAEGIALMFAQARSLGFMMIAAGQDIAAMAKGENKEEVDSMIANTKIKYTLALEDPDKTLDVFKKVAGQSITVETGSYEGSVSNLTSTSYRQNLTGSIQRRDRIELQELKALKEMQGILIFKDQVTRARSFTWFHSTKFSDLPFRLNRFLQVDKPKREDLNEKLKPLDQADSRFTTIDRIMKKIRLGRTPTYIGTIDPIVDALLDTYRVIETHNPNEIAVNRGIAYYMAAVAAMRKHQPDEAGRYWEPIEVDPSTLDDSAPLDIGDEDESASASPRSVEVEGVGEGARNPVYHDPPLQEKAKDGESFEDLVRQFTERPSDAKRTDPSSFVLPDYEAEATPVKPVEKSVPISDPMGNTPAADDDLDAFLQRFQSPETAAEAASGGEEPAQASSDVATDHPVLSSGAFAEEVMADLDPTLMADLGERQEKEVVIGFTEKTAETLVKIEEALGSENPMESMKTTEAEISAQLKWTKSVDDMSEADLDNMFSSIEATINRSASRVK